MSIERELLKKVISGDDDGDFFISHRLYKDIETFLAQPEQEHVGIVRIIGGYPDNSERVVDWVRPYKYLKDGDKLYLAPKREPLTPQQISSGNQSTLNVTREAFKQGVIFAEKAHGIGGEI